MFTLEQRDALRERLIRFAEEDARVVAAALVGSLAVDGGDRYSDVDFTLGIADDVPVSDVLDAWTSTLVRSAAWRRVRGNRRETCRTASRSLLIMIRATRSRPESRRRERRCNRRPRRFTRFRRQLPAMCHRLHLHPNSLIFVDYAALVSE